IDQVISNAVTVTLGNDTLEFVRQPDGSFTPPAGSTMTLTKGSGYTLQARRGNTFVFNSGRQLTTITNPSGNQLTLTYSSGLLTQPNAWKNRTVTFTYWGSRTRLGQVSDSTGRSVYYGYATASDGNPDLVSVRDPEGKTNRFLYDTNHQITATVDAL